MIAIIRDQDKPYITSLDKDEVKELLEDHECILPCNLMEFPSMSAILIDGEILTSFDDFKHWLRLS